MRTRSRLNPQEDFYNKELFALSTWSRAKGHSDLSDTDKNALWKLERTYPVKLIERNGFFGMIQTSVEYIVPTLMFLKNHNLNGSVSGHCYIGAAPRYHTSTKVTFTIDDRMVRDALRTVFQDYSLNRAEDGKTIVLKVPESDPQQFEAYLERFLKFVPTLKLEELQLKYENYTEPPIPLSVLFAV